MRKIVVYSCVLAVVIILVTAGYLLMNPGSKPNDLVGTPVSGAQLSQLRAIALNSTLANNVGAGSTVNGGMPNYPTPVNDSSALVVDGKVGIVYVSADYCPYCAVNRWGLVMALMRFGNFTGLRYMESGSKDVYPDTATFTFSNASYSSGSIYLDAVETGDINGKPLNAPDALQTALLTKYDSPGSIPFTVFGNRSTLVGAMVSPQALQGSSWAQIIAQLNNTSSPTSQALIGSANIFTAYICRTGLAGISNASACKQAYVKSINGA